MQCHCGSKKFLPLGVQEALNPKTLDPTGKELYLINCVECGTTISCSKEFYLELTVEQAEDALAERYTNFHYWQS